MYLFSLLYFHYFEHALVLFARFSLRLSLPLDSLGRPLTSTRRPTSSVSFGRGRERGGKTSLHGAERETGRKIGIAILLARMKKCKRQLNILLICLCRVRTSVVHSPPGNPFCPREPLERERERKEKRVKGNGGVTISPRPRFLRFQSQESREIESPPPSCLACLLTNPRERERERDREERSKIESIP